MLHVPQTRQLIAIRWPKDLNLEQGTYTGKYDAMYNPYDLSVYVSWEDAVRTYGLYASLSGEPLRGASAEAPSPGRLASVRTASRLQGQEVTLERPVEVQLDQSGAPKSPTLATLQAAFTCFRHDLPALVERRLLAPDGTVIRRAYYSAARVRQISFSDADIGDDNGVITLQIRLRPEFYWTEE